MALLGKCWLGSWIPRIARSGAEAATEEARIQTRRKELLVASGQVQSAVAELLAQNAKALALYKDICGEFGDKEARKLFRPVHLALPTDAADWLKHADRPKNKGRAPSLGNTQHTRAHRASNPDLLTVDQVCEFFGGITPAGLYKGIKAKRYPKPIKIGPQTARWLRTECVDTLHRLAEQRTT